MRIDQHRILYVGSFTPGSREKGITILDFSTEHSTFAELGAEPGGSPNFLAWHPTEDIVYVAEEIEEGGISAYRVRPDSSLELINRQATAGYPCHVTIGRVESRLFATTAHYFTGFFGLHSIEADGTVGPVIDQIDRNASRDGIQPPTSRAHSTTWDPAGRFLLATDLGQDEVITYRVDAESGRFGELSVARTEPHAGPRHLAWHPDGRVFVAGELDGSITTFRIDADSGVLEHVGRRASLANAPADAVLTGIAVPAEITLSHGGRFLHIANRGRNEISTFRTGPGDELQPVGDVPSGGAWPRHIATIDDELYAANDQGHTVAAFRVDPDSGVLNHVATTSVASAAFVLIGR